MCRYIESICIEKGQIQNLSFHNKRFNTTRKELFGSSSFVNLEDFINAETHFERTKCRVIYDQEIIEVSYQPYKLPSINCLSLVFDNEINYQTLLHTRPPQDLVLNNAQKEIPCQLLQQPYQKPSHKMEVLHFQSLEKQLYKYLLLQQTKRIKMKIK